MLPDPCSEGRGVEGKREEEEKEKEMTLVSFAGCSPGRRLMPEKSPSPFWLEVRSPR